MPFGKLSVVEGISEEVALEQRLKMKGRCESCEQLGGTHSRQREQQIEKPKVGKNCLASETES